MTFSDDSVPLPNHPINPERARELIAGDLGDVFRMILADCAAPFYAVGGTSEGRWKVCSNGTLTFVKTPERIIGVTAAHVFDTFRTMTSNSDVQCQLMNALFDGEVIDESADLDLITFAISPELIAATGKTVTPVPIANPNDCPQEGRAIMLAGYPGNERKELAPLEVEWGFFTALGIARRVNKKQITWIPDREHNVITDEARMPPPNQDLGGISGGPLIAWYETSTNVSYYSLAGIVVEANANLENVVAIRSDFIRPDGSLSRS